MNSLMIEFITPIIILIKLKERISLVILRTRKALKTLIERRADTFPPVPIISSIKLIATTPASHIFIKSPKNDMPYANILIAKSMTNINVNT